MSKPFEHPLIDFNSCGIMLEKHGQPNHSNGDTYFSVGAFGVGVSDDEIAKLSFQETS